MTTNPQDPTTLSVQVSDDNNPTNDNDEGEEEEEDTASVIVVDLEDVQEPTVVGGEDDEDLDELDPHGRPLTQSSQTVNRTEEGTEVDHHKDSGKDANPDDTSAKSENDGYEGPLKRPCTPRNMACCCCHYFDHLDEDCLRVWSIIPRLFTTIAWAISLILLLDCQFISITARHFAKPIPNATNSTTVYAMDLYDTRFGLFYYQDLQTIPVNYFQDLNRTGIPNGNVTVFSSGFCQAYPDDIQFSSAARGGRACAIAAVALGGWLALILWSSYCCRFLCLCCPDFLVILNLLLILPVLQGLSYTFSLDVCRRGEVSSQAPLEMLLPWLTNETLYQDSVDYVSCSIPKTGFYYPLSIILWITSGLLYLLIKPRSYDDLNFFRN